MWTFNVFCSILCLVVEAKASQEICLNSSLTFDKYSFLNTIPLPAINKTSLIFSVRACKHARIIFTGNTTHSKCSYRIVLGYSRHNVSSRATVCTSCNGELDPKCKFTSVITPGILDCNEFKTFWISIGNGYIRFGKGNTLNSNELGHNHLFDKIVPDYVGINVVSSTNYHSKWRFENEFLPYISPDLFCETKEMTEPETHVDVTTSAGNATSSLPDDQSCKCQCSTVTHKWDYLNNLNLTKDELRKELSAYLNVLQQSVAITTKSTSKSKAKRVSAADSRLSSATLGWLGAFIVAIIPLSFICIDLLNVFKKILTNFNCQKRGQ